MSQQPSRIVLQTPLDKMSGEELAFRRMMSKLYHKQEVPDDWGASKSGRPRELHIAPIYARYEHLSGVLVQVNGSAPKGTLFVAMDDSAHTIRYACFMRAENRKFIDNGTVAPKAQKALCEIIRSFIESLKIPALDPDIILDATGHVVGRHSLQQVEDGGKDN